MKIKRILQKIANNIGYKIIKKPDERRGSTRFVQENLKGRLTIVEIGTFREENALNILKNLNVKKIYLIDPYFYEEYDGGGIKNNYLPYSEKLARKKLKKYPQVEFIKKTSKKAINNIPNNVDFIYIDGNPNYEFVKSDIEKYYKKLRKGGVLGGHNIEMEDVIKAFLEFINKNKLEPFINLEDWGVIKK